MTINQHLSRRRFVLGASSAAALTALHFSQQSLANSLANATKPHTTQLNVTPVLRGNQFDLQIGYQPVNYTGKNTVATTVNGSLPAPVLYWKEGDRVTLRVTNNLEQQSSVHWHGIILPSTMDGSPGFDFSGINPGETFEYQFDVKQSGTYWYHSHSGYQEQTGLFGAIIIEPKVVDPIIYDRDLVILLSDWTDTPPEKIYSRLKKMSHYYNYRERTVADTFTTIKTEGLVNTWKQRAMWNRMRMSDTDISDVTGYTFLMNGCTPEQNWIGLFKPGEKVRLRFINAAAMTLFDIRIPGLKMTVVAADGQAVKPVTVDEFRIGNAENYDVIVTPDASRTYAIFAQTMDRTGFAVGTLGTQANAHAEIPVPDEPFALEHRDMGMDMAGSNHSDHGQASSKPLDQSTHQLHTMNHGNHNTGETEHTNHHEMDHSQHSSHDVPAYLMDHSNHVQTINESTAPRFTKAGLGNNSDDGKKTIHRANEFGPQVDMHTVAPRSGLDDPGVGLREHAQRYNRRVLSYADLRSLTPTRDRREPTREIELHLTGNMHRYMWSINGESFMDAAPLQLTYGERVRIILINDTMMTHPIHLHGMWSELETGDPDFIPRKHTILVQPGSKISYLVTADAKGHWAYHCHLLYHMFGMMRMVEVS